MAEIYLNTPTSNAEAKIVYKFGVPDIEQNYTPVYVSVQIRKKSSTATLGTFSGSGQIDGSSSNISRYGQITTNWVEIGSFSKNVRHDVDGNKDCYIGATFRNSGTTMGGTYNGGQTIRIPTIPRYANVYNSINSATLTSVTINWSADSDIDWIQYRINGIDWVDAGGNPYTVGELTPNTYYTIETRARRTDSGLWSNAGAIGFTTLKECYITNNPSFIVGNNISLIVYNPLNYNVTMDLRINNVLLISRQMGKGTNFNFGFSDEELKLIYQNMSNVQKCDMSFAVGTFSDNYASQIGSWQFTYGTSYINIEINKPAFNDFTYKDVNPDSLIVTGNQSQIIKGVSVIQIDISQVNLAQARNFAKIVKYRAYTDGGNPQEFAYNGQSVISFTITSDGSNIHVFAIDSRGIETEVKKQIGNFVDYEFPYIKDVYFYREDGIGNKVFFKLNAHISLINFGIVTNGFYNLQFMYRRKGDEDWLISNASDFKINVDENGNVTEKTDGTNFVPRNGNPNTNLSFDNVEYEIKLNISDYLNQLSESDILSDTFILNSGIPNMATRKNSNGRYTTGINKFPSTNENSAFDILGDVYITGNLYVNDTKIN